MQYPNATEINHSGIGNIPYIIERADYSTREYPNATNIDNHPLIYPYDIDQDTISFSSPSPSVPEFSWLAIIPLMVAILSFALILRASEKHKLR